MNPAEAVLVKLMRDVLADVEVIAESSYGPSDDWRAEWSRADPTNYSLIQRAKAALAEAESRL